MWSRWCKFTPLDPTKQYLHCMRKVTTWCHFENLPPPSNLQNHAVDSIWRRLTCWVIAIGLSSGPLQNTLFDIWTNLASWVMFEMSFPSPTTKQDVERTKLEPRVMFGIYAYWTIHSNTFNIWIKLTCWFILLDLPALSPTKYEPAWHLDLCQNVPCLPLQQDNTLNTWKERHLESFLKFTVPRPYKAIRLKKRWNLTRRVIFSNLASLDPTKQTVEHVQKIDMWAMWGYFWNL